MSQGRAETSLNDALRDVLVRLGGDEPRDPASLSRAEADLTAAIERLRAQRRRLVHETAESDSGHVLERLAAHQPQETRYHIEGELARGGMGAILEVTDLDLRRRLAMKVALPRSAGSTHVDDTTLARFLDEAQVTGQLDHPGVVPVHELGLDREGRVYFTMRLVQGRDLANVFELARRGEEGWTQTRVLGALLKACEALAYAHSKGVIHRDLKPANVMIGRFGEVYVMDWGLAKLVGREGQRESARAVAPSAPGGAGISPATALGTVDGTVLGTPSYMSPEQARGEIESLDARCDVYALGAMLYHLLAGTPPYRDRGDSDGPTVLRHALAGPPRALSEVAPGAPPELTAICERAMARDRRARYGDMLALSDDLRAWLEGRVVRAYESGAWPELKKWVRRNRALSAACAGTMLAVVGGALWTSHVEARGREDLRLTADAYVPDYLIEGAEHLSVADRNVVPRIESWLAVARDLISRRELHRARCDALASADSPSRDGTDVDRERVQRLVGQLDALARPGDGLLARMEARLSRAIEVRESSVASAEAQRRWSDAIEAIADPARHPAYAGLRLTPQFGLLPLGPDPNSGLWEFTHLVTGDPPERDPATGALGLTEDTGVVLVLVPGETFWQGEQATDPNGRQYFQDAWVATSPSVEVTLGPFFISKYEMTQAQWQRATGSNPSVYNRAWLQSNAPSLAPRAGLHPVEQVTWLACVSVLRELGLALPTEAQWECAARAGTSSTWWTGEDRHSLVGAANLADLSIVRAGGSDVARAAAADWPEFDDGFIVHSPVDAFRPNPFGLYGVIGNVWEWCADGFGPLTDPAREGDGYRVGRDPLVTARGGSFESKAAAARHANRGNAPLDQVHSVMGVRPARALDP